MMERDSRAEASREDAHQALLPLPSLGTFGGPSTATAGLDSKSVLER